MLSQSLPYLITNLQILGGDILHITEYVCVYIYIYIYIYTYIVCV